ncbi:MAG: hypothetical protein WD231_05820 [Candidatus Woykebacteria bacterium]
MKRFLLPVFLISLISWVVFAYIIWKIPPTIPAEVGGELVKINLVYFSASLWVGLTTLVSLLLYFISFLFQEAPKKSLPLQEDLRPRRVFRTSLRRGAIFATAVLILGIFKIYDLDNLINSIFIVSIALLIEVYFSSR